MSAPARGRTGATAPGDKLVATATGDITVKIPKVRSGSVFPSLLAPRRRADVALHMVVMQARVEGVSTRKVDDLVVLGWRRRSTPPPQLRK